MIVAFDGHDGSGKTSLAQRVADLSGAAYARPFGGERGERLFALASAGRYEEANRHALACVRTAQLGAGDAVVFDRHWMTVFTLLPEAYWDAWSPLPCTIVCSTDLDTTLSRLGERERRGAGEENHERWIALYRSLAERFGCEILDTTRTNVEETARALAARLTA
ncbi:MAG: glycosyl transferase group 1 [Candidatus Eremiobacteraeota bacterium]|nr:glycosyl transferase group 1 [Candidatus Eremiobacteraeota bacterium]